MIEQFIDVDLDRILDNSSEAFGGIRFEFNTQRGPNQ
ncbi:MAG: hypothetical protein ACJA1L_002852 [Paracoccaceae bacterium]|jgi:hypothetical protein